MASDPAKRQQQRVTDSPALRSYTVGGAFYNPATNSFSSGIPLSSVLAKGIGDFDQDGDTDFIAVENKAMPLAIYLNNGSGVFTKKALHEEGRQ